MTQKEPKEPKLLNHIDLTPDLTKRYKPYPRKIGRYSASEAWSIINGFTTPEKWLNPEPPDFKGMMNMWNGIQGHESVQGLLDKAKCEQKQVFEYGEIQLVGKADYLPNAQEVWEFKTSLEAMTSAKPWHIHQVKLYCTMFKRPVGLVLQPVTTKDKFLLRELGRVNRDDDWFQEQLDKLVAFHEQVKALAKQQDSLPLGVPSDAPIEFAPAYNKNKKEEITHENSTA